MPVTTSTLLHALAHHAYGPKPDGPPRLERILGDVWCRARHGAVSEAAYRVMTALYPRPRRANRHPVRELALHLALLGAGVAIAGAALGLGPVLLRKSDGVDLPHALGTMPGLGVWVAREPGRGCLMGELLDAMEDAEAREAGRRPRRRIRLEDFDCTLDAEALWAEVRERHGGARSEGRTDGAWEADPRTGGCGKQSGPDVD